MVRSASLASAIGFILIACTASSQVFNLASDFSSTHNPSGPWSYGCEPVGGGSFTLYVDNTFVPAWYNTTQLAGWERTDSWYVAKNVSDTPWFYDGRPVGEGIAIVDPGHTFIHPGSATWSVARWTAPANGAVSLNVVLARLEQVQGRASDYSVLLNGVALAGCSGHLIGYGTPASSATLAPPWLGVATGDTLDFAIGPGPDGSNTDATDVQATIAYVPEPGAMIAVLFGCLSTRLLARRRWC